MNILHPGMNVRAPYSQNFSPEAHLVLSDLISSCRLLTVILLEAAWSLCVPSSFSSCCLASRAAA